MSTQTAVPQDLSPETAAVETIAFKQKLPALDNVIGEFELDVPTTFEAAREAYGEDAEAIIMSHFKRSARDQMKSFVGARSEKAKDLDELYDTIASEFSTTELNTRQVSGKAAAKARIQEIKELLSTPMDSKERKALKDELSELALALI